MLTPHIETIIAENKKNRWLYLEAEPATDAPVCDNPSGLYCPGCRAVGYSHCSEPEYCGGMRRMKPAAPKEPTDEQP